MKYYVCLFGSLFCGFLISGCSGIGEKQSDEMIIGSCPEHSIRLDADASEPVWKNTVPYDLHLIPQSRYVRENAPFQPGTVRFLFDRDYLYVSAELADDDIVQYGSDNEDLCKRGDLLEIFIRNCRKGCYWEIHLSPAGKSALLFYPNAGRRIFPEAIAKSTPVKLAVRLDGTLNNCRDNDRGFRIEAAIPREVFGNDFGENGIWTVMAARYNYSRSFKVSQLSVSAALPAADFHLVDFHTPVKFVHPGK